MNMCKELKLAYCMTAKTEYFHFTQNFNLFCFLFIFFIAFGLIGGFFLPIERPDSMWEGVSDTMYTAVSNVAVQSAKQQTLSDQKSAPDSWIKFVGSASVPCSNKICYAAIHKFPSSMRNMKKIIITSIRCECVHVFECVGMECSAFVVTVCALYAVYI